MFLGTSLSSVLNLSKRKKGKLTSTTPLVNTNKAEMFHFHSAKYSKQNHTPEKMTERLHPPWNESNLLLPRLVTLLI